MKPGRLWAGTVFLALGIFGLLDVAGVVDASQTIGRWWPLTILGLGLPGVIAQRRVGLGDLTLVALGVALLADEQNWTSDIVIWSLLLSFIGLAFLLLPRGGVRFGDDRAAIRPAATGTPGT